MEKKFIIYNPITDRVYQRNGTDYLCAFGKVDDIHIDEWEFTMVVDGMWTAMDKEDPSQECWKIIEVKDKQWGWDGPAFVTKCYRCGEYMGVTSTSGDANRPCPECQAEINYERR